ncbi:MAG: YHS domain-containing (seleno)protein [Hellea sp.]
MKTIMITLALVLTAGSAAPVMAADAIYTSWKNNLAVGGYDTVSFFSGKPQIGKKDLSFDYAGAEWRFATRGNLDLFKTNPEAFMPQYGGYCAWAVAQDKLAKGSPDHWHVEDGKLYLNFNARIKRRWDKDISGYITSAEGNWPDILKD